MATPEVVMDPAGIAALYSTGQAVAVLTDRAEAMKSEAERIAPKHFMGYPKDFTIARGRSQAGAASVEVGNSGSGWHLVEFGSANNVPHHVLERSARAAGLEWRGASR